MTSIAGALKVVYVPEYEGQSKLKQIEMMKRVKLEHFYDLEHFAKITNERLENARLHLGSIVKRIDELGGGINDEDRRFLDDDEARDSVDERMTLSGSEAVQKDHYVVGNIIAKMTKKELIDELLGCFGLDDCLENGYVVQIADEC